MLETKRHIYDKFGKLESYILHKHDSNAKLTKISYFDNSGEPINYEVFEYNDAGTLARRSRFHRKSLDLEYSLDFYRTFEHDEDGYMTKALSFTESAELKEYTIYEYGDPKRRIEWMYPPGNVVKQKTFDSSDALKEYAIYDYNKKGRLAKRSDYDSHNALKSYATYDYDKSGNLTKYSHFGGNDLAFYTTYDEYDKNGNPNKLTRFDSSGNLEKTYVKEWSSSG
jgi:hypothetical protein